MIDQGKVVVYIDTEKVRPNPFQPRKTFTDDALIDLAESIISYGVLQPITVRECEDGHFELIAGERRLRATEYADIKRIPAIVVDINDEESAALALIENIQRENLNFLEEAQGLNNLILQYDFTQKELASKIGKSQSAVANKLRLLKLDSEILEKCVANNLTERHVRALLRLSSKKHQMEALDKIIKMDLTVKKTERLIADMIEALDEDKEAGKKQTIKSIINYRIYLNTLKRAYQDIRDTGVDVEYDEKDTGDFIEVVVKFPKKK